MAGPWSKQLGFSQIILIVLVIAILIVISLVFRSKPNPSITPIPSPIPSQKGLKFDFPPAQTDPFNNRNGPFYRQIFMARSQDGLNFTKEEKILFDKASVPDVINLPNGRLLLYAVDGARRSKSGLLVALSDDGGRSWDVGSLKLKGAGSFGGADPDAVLLNDGTLRLYFVVFKEGQNQILSAVSQDGINFEEEDGIRFSYPQITDPDIVNINGKWFMYLSQGPILIVIVSDDGLSWKFEKIIRNFGSVTGTIYVDTNLWRQYYCTNGAIKSATTSDGLKFIEEEGVRLKETDGKLICDPSPVHLDGQWLLFFKLAS